VRWAPHYLAPGTVGLRADTEGVNVSQREWSREMTHGVEGETILLLLVSRIANGKVETEGERDRGNACDPARCCVTRREKIRPFLKRGLERFLEEFVINVRDIRQGHL